MNHLSFLACKKENNKWITCTTSSKLMKFQQAIKPRVIIVTNVDTNI